MHEVTLIRYWGSHFKSERQLNNIIAELSGIIRRKWNVYLVLEICNYPKNWLRKIEDSKIKILVNDRPKRKYDLKCIYSTYKICKKYRATIFHCDNIHISTMIGAYLARVPIRIWCKRAMNIDYEECRKPSFKERIAFVTRLTCGLATGIIAVSNTVKNELVNIGIKQDKITVQNNPIKLGKRLPTKSREEIRKEWGAKQTDIIIISIGHAVPVKGWDILIKAFSNVVQRAPNTKLVLVGSYNSTAEKQYFNKINKYTEEQKINNKIIFTGYLAEVQDALIGADLFVLPSRSEGCCNALVEAMELNLPVIVSRVGNAEEIITHGKNGYLFGRCNIDELTKYIYILITDEKKRSEIISNMEIAKNVTTMDIYSEKIASVYEQQIKKYLA